MSAQTNTVFPGASHDVNDAASIPQIKCPHQAGDLLSFDTAAIGTVIRMDLGNRSVGRYGNVGFYYHRSECDRTDSATLSQSR